MRKAIMVLLVLLSATGLASAGGSQITIDPLWQKIDVGAIGTYSLTLQTIEVGPGHMSWETNSDKIYARINGGTFAQSGSIDLTTPPAKQEFTLEVQPQTGVTQNKEYDITITYLNQQYVAKAKVTGTVEPVPELSTMALMSAGMIGMIALVRRQRRD